MAFGIGRLGLSPHDFWKATPRELAAAARGVLGGATAPGMRRGELAALVERFPDDG